MTNLRSTFARGAAWMVLFKLADRSLGLVSTLVLARILVPADFGLVAMATSLIAMLEMFGAFGVDIALIQKEGATREHYDTAWTMNAGVGVFVALLLVLCAWPLSRYYQEPRLVALVCVLAIGSAVQGFENIGVVAFRKELKFEREFRFLMIKRVLSFFMTITLALWLRSYWALAFGTVFSRFAGVTISYLLHPFRPHLSTAHFREFFHFSKWLVASNFVMFFKDRAPDFIVGRIAGAHAIGILSLSTEIASLPGSELIAPINRAAVPVYAALAKDKSAFERQFITVLSLTALLIVPVVVGLALMAPLVVALLLGPRWAEAGHIMSFFAFLGLTNVFIGSVYPAVMAAGKPAVYTKIFLLQLCVLVPSMIYFTQRDGVTGAAMACLGTALTLLPFNIYVVMRTLGFSTMGLLRGVWRTLLAAAVMYLATRWLMPAVDTATLSSLAAGLLLLQFVLVGASIYLAALGALWLASGRPAGAEQTLLSTLGGAFRRVSASFGLKA